MDRYRDDLTGYLSRFVTPQRFGLFRQVIEQRTRYITILLEDIYQSQNASAVLRTCDCTGIQDVHIVEKRNTYDINPDVALGSDQWLTMHYYRSEKDNTSLAVESLRKAGYRIVATSPGREGNDPDNFDLERGRAVIMFGTELTGLGEKALELADEFIQIPMVGFTESYNISVSAAIILYQLRQRLERSELSWNLEAKEKSELLLGWLRQNIKRSDLIEREFRENYQGTF